MSAKILGILYIQLEYPINFLCILFEQVLGQADLKKVKRRNLGFDRNFVIQRTTKP